MIKTIALLALCLCLVSAANIDHVKSEHEVEQPRACYCVAWFGGVCIQLGGGSACTSGKRDAEVEEKCLCLTWNSQGICIFCAGK
jgi:hypothetical protein